MWIWITFSNCNRAIESESISRELYMIYELIDWRMHWTWNRCVFFVCFRINLGWASAFLVSLFAPQLLSPSVTSPETRAWNYMLFPFVATVSNGWKVIFAGGPPLLTRPKFQTEPQQQRKKSNLIDGNIRNKFRLKMILHAPIKRFVELDFFSVVFFLLSGEFQHIKQCNGQMRMRA